MQNTTPLLELRGITKTFDGFVANDHIDLDVFPGEVHAVLGENGAGKSTLMNIIYGMYKPDSGSIRVNGELVQILSPRDALEHKIGMVHQHFMLVEVLSAIDNISLLSEEKLFSPRDKKKMKARLQELQSQYHIDVDITSPVEQLSIGMQQKVEILKLLYTGADVLIFDEPTAVLPPQECDGLFEIIANLTAEGKGVIFISHKLDEVLRISQRITVLTHGRVTGQIHTEDADKTTLVRMMVGEDVAPPVINHAETTPGKVLIRTERSAPGTTVAFRHSMAWIWKSGPVKWWAWPAWRATARLNLPRCLPVSAMRSAVRCASMEKQSPPVPPKLLFKRRLPMYQLIATMWDQLAIFRSMRTGFCARIIRPAGLDSSAIAPFAVRPPGCGGL